MAMSSLAPSWRKTHFENWTKGALAVLFTKNGLTEFVSAEVDRHHQRLLQLVPAANIQNTCNCTINSLPQCTRSRNHSHIVSGPRQLCSRGVCNILMDMICRDHRFRAPSWKNTDPQKWCTNAFEVAKCYMPPDGYSHTSSLSETDLNGIIAVIINNLSFSTLIQDNLATEHNICTKVRKVGRDIRHSANYEMSESDLSDYIDDLINLLRDPACLLNDPSAQDAVTKLKLLKANDLTLQEKDITKVSRDEIKDTLCAELGDFLQKCNDHYSKLQTQLVELVNKLMDAITRHAELKKQEIEHYEEMKEKKEFEEKLEATQLNGDTINDIQPLEVNLQPRRASIDLERIIPLEILQTDRDSIALYKKALAEGAEAIHNIRVMIVGHFGVGKTTLTKRLLGQDIDIDHQESTDGIDVHVKRCKVDIKSGNWIIRQKGDERESVYRRLASILKRKRKPSPEIDNTEIQTKGESAPFLAPVQQNTATLVTEKDNPGFLKRLFRKMKLKKSSRTILNRQQQKETEPGKENLTTSNKEACFEASTESNEVAYLEATTNSNEEEFFEELAEELKQLPLEDSLNTADQSIWDFAGQYCFYDTHQVFLSRRTIFLLVTDLSKSLEDIVQDDTCYPDSTGKVKWTVLDFVEFWLKSIHEFCSHPENTASKNAEDIHSSERCKPTFGPPVILVGTFADKLHQNDRKLAVEPYFSRLRECLVQKNDHVAASHLIENDFAIDNTLETGASDIDSLKKQILETAKLQSYWGEHVPARWTSLEKIILNLKSEGLQVLNIRYLVELNNRLPAPLQNDKDIETFLTFHHDCGNIIYYRNEEDLKENIILSPQWLVDAFKCLITAESFCRKFPKLHKKWLDFNRTAVFDRELIDEIWDNNDKSDFKDHKDLLLNYLEKLGLIARILPPMQQEKERIKDGNLYLAPCMLKNCPPKDLIENATKKKTTSKICFTTASRFLPTAVFNKLLAACIQLFRISRHKNQYHIYCGCGVFDVLNGHEMVVFFHDNVIQIWLLKYSIDEPNTNTCFEQRQFVTDFLKRHLTTLKIYVKCPQDSAYSDYMFDIDDLLKQEEVACGCQGQEKHAVATQQLTKYWFASKQSAGEIPRYKMDQEPRGWCIIINIEKFAKCSKLSTRNGTEYDKDRLMDVFRNLHFNVEFRDNLKSKKIMRYLRRYSSEVDHSSFDCFVCCILSHGSLGHVYGSDGKRVPIKDMTSLFTANRCPSLAGKPKLFFLQACQGDELMQGVAVAANIEPDGNQEETIPFEADFLIGYSTVPGYVSYREPYAGSWYIRLLCEVLKECKDSCHLLEILTEVNRRVAEESAAGKRCVHKQIPAPQTTLRKKVYFR